MLVKLSWKVGPLHFFLTPDFAWSNFDRTHQHFGRRHSCSPDCIAHYGRNGKRREGSRTCASSLRKLLASFLAMIVGRKGRMWKGGKGTGLVFFFTLNLKYNIQSLCWRGTAQTEASQPECRPGPSIPKPLHSKFFLSWC